MKATSLPAKEYPAIGCSQEECLYRSANLYSGVRTLLIFLVVCVLIVSQLTGCVFNQSGKTIRYIRYPVQADDTLSTIAKRFSVTTQEILAFNNLSNPHKIEIGALIKIPYRGEKQKNSVAANKNIIRKVSADAASLKTVNLNRAKQYIGLLLWPVSTGKLSSYFGSRWGSFHEGVDIAAPMGTAIRASHGGTVVYSGSGLKGYGNLVVIKGDGLLTVYAHNRSNNVRVGAAVRRGDVVAYLGNSGKSTGPHLHFETRIKNKDGKNAAVDPLVFYPKLRS